MSYIHLESNIHHLPPKQNASMPLLLEIEGLSMPLLGGRSGSMNGATSGKCKGCGRGSVDGVDGDTCQGER